MNLRASRFKRHDAGHTKLGGMAHNVIHHSPLRQSLRQSDGTRQWRSQTTTLSLRAHGDEGGPLARLDQSPSPFTSPPVKNHHRIANPGTVHHDEVV